MLLFTGLNKQFLCCKKNNKKRHQGKRWGEAKDKATQQHCKTACYRYEATKSTEIKKKNKWSYARREEIQTDRQRHRPTEKSSSRLATRFIGHSLRCLRVIWPACEEVISNRKEDTRVRNQNTDKSNKQNTHNNQCFILILQCISMFTVCRCYSVQAWCVYLVQGRHVCHCCLHVVQHKYHQKTKSPWGSRAAESALVLMWSWGGGWCMTVPCCE